MTHEPQLFRKEMRSSVEHVNIGSCMELSERGEMLTPVRSATLDLLPQTRETAAQAGSHEMILLGSGEVLISNH